MMSIDEFLVKLKESKIDFFVDKHGKIRANGPTASGHTACPLSALCEMDASFWWDCATVLGVSLPDANQIIRAADYRDFHKYAFGDDVGQLRIRLIDACGLPAEVPSV